MATSAKSARQANIDFGGPETAIMHRILQENWWVIVLRGIIGILFGLVAMFMPGVTLLSIVYVFSAYMLVDGAFSIAGAIRSRGRNQRWGWMLLNGLLSVITGILAFIWPGITAVAFVLVLAAWSIVSGALVLAAGFQMKNSRGRGWMILMGIISLLFGILLAISPIIGAIVLTVWIGAYVLVTSIILLIVAATVRSKSTEAAEAGRPPA